MRGLLAVTVLAVAAAGALAGAVPGTSNRQARWFLSRADVTEVVEEEKLITQVTPWSCVVVAPSLPPCRHVRQLNIAATPPTPILATAAPALGRFHGDHNLVEASRRRYYLEQAMAPVGSLDAFHSDMVPVPNAPHGPSSGWVPLMAREATEPLPAAPAAPVAAAPPAPSSTAASGISLQPAPQPEKKREQGWAEWLGLRAYTVTSTVVKYATTKVVDPDTVVTFSVRGCQPSRLPFDMPLCVAQQAQAAQAAQPEATAPAVEVSAAGPTPAEAPAAAPAAAAAPPASPAPIEKTSMAPIVVAAAPPATAAETKVIEKPTAAEAAPAQAAAVQAAPAAPAAIATPAKV